MKDRRDGHRAPCPAAVMMQKLWMPLSFMGDQTMPFFWFSGIVLDKELFRVHF